MLADRVRVMLLISPICYLCSQNSTSNEVTFLDVRLWILPHIFGVVTVNDSGG